MTTNHDDITTQLVRRSTQLFFGKYRGSVTDNDDPEHRGRIKARVPGVLGGTVTGWALPALPFAGDGHGLVMLPKVDATVWIEFEAGNPDIPIWTGCFYAGNAKRPEPDGVDARSVTSVKGHKLVFDDAEDKITVEHSSGARIELSQTEISIEITGSKMVMSQTSITFNDGVLKIGPGGLSLANGAMTLGVPPT